MNAAEQAYEWAEKISAAGVDTYIDPRSAVPPCALITPPNQRFEGNCSAVCEWRVYAIAPGGPNLDAWSQLEEMQTPILSVLPAESRLYVGAVIAPDQPAQPAFLYLFEGSVDT